MPNEIQYIATIRREDDKLVARDEKNETRAWCYAEKAPAVRGRKLAEFLFGRNQIGSVKVLGNKITPATFVEVYA